MNEKKSRNYFFNHHLRFSHFTFSTWYVQFVWFPVGAKVKVEGIEKRENNYV